MATETVMQVTPEPSHEDQMDQLWHDFLSCEPLASSQDEVMELEDQVNRDGVLRRIVLATTPFGGKELLEKTKEDGGAYVIALAIKAGQHWIERTRELIGIMETQVVRLELSLMETEGMESLLEKAEAELFD